jgi:tetratricopeptide (TPR) repeat protein
LLAFDLTKRRNPDCCFNIAKCYFLLGNIDKAIEQYRVTLKLEPDDKYSFYELGYCFASQTTPAKDSALKYYSLAIEQDKNYYDAFFNRGLLYATQLKDIKKGHEDFERSIEIKPKNKLSYLYNGMLYRDEDELGKAKDMLSKVIELYPEYADAYVERAVTWYKIGILNMVC